MKKIMYFCLLVVISFASCQKERNSDNIQVPNLSLRSLLDDPISLNFQNIGYVYLQTANIRDDSETKGGFSKNNTMSTFKVNNLTIPSNQGKTNEYIINNYGSNISLPVDNNYTIQINNKSSTLPLIRTKLVENSNREISVGTNFTWNNTNYSGPAWFGIKQNSIQNGGDILSSIATYYEEVQGNSIEITSNMLTKFPDNTEVTIYVGVATYSQDGSDLFIVGNTYRSYTYKINK